jgi:hypothetical protein
MPNPQSQMEDEPPINEAIENILAIAGGDEANEALLLRTIIVLSAERLARVSGRGESLRALRGLTGHIQNVAKDWKD